MLLQQLAQEIEFHPSLMNVVTAAWMGIVVLLLKHSPPLLIPVTLFETTVVVRPITSPMMLMVVILLLKPSIYSVADQRDFLRKYCRCTPEHVSNGSRRCVARMLDYVADWRQMQLSLVPDGKRNSGYRRCTLHHVFDDSRCFAVPTLLSVVDRHQLDPRLVSDGTRHSDSWSQGVSSVAVTCVVGVCFGTCFDLCCVMWFVVVF